SDADDFSPGSLLEIKCGYHDDTVGIFKGIIIKHGIRKRPDSPSMLIIECRDQAIKMTATRKSVSFTDSSDSEVMTKIIGDSGVQSEVSATTGTLPEITQYDCTDWDFIAIRAQLNGMVLLVDAGKVTVKQPDM